MIDRTHAEPMPAPWVATACDPGLRHATNEDAVAVRAVAEPGRHAVLVVCDGVSSAPNSASAAATASNLVADAMAEPDADTAPRLSTAIMRANMAVAELAPHQTPPPSCTIAAAVVSDHRLVVGWIGDSRVYWFPDAGSAQQLTSDDSMAQLRIEWGVERELAEHGPGAHTITRWLGRGAPTDPPHIVQYDIDVPGWLLVCSDGLWNYASDPDALARVVASGRPSPEPDGVRRLARDLVAWANDQGGADNVTVAVARLVGAHRVD